MDIPFSKTQLEPCLKDRCRSPVMCDCFGYCRERNEGKQPTPAQLVERREIARSRNIDSHTAKGEYPDGAPMYSQDGTMLDRNGNRSIFDDVDE